MRQPKQLFIFNDDELDLIKKTFAENEPLVYSVRKVLLQFPLTEAERGLIKLSITSDVWAVLKKKLLPDLSDDFPLTQLSGLVVTLSNDLKVRGVEDAAPLIEAKALEIAYLEQQFAVLKDIDGNLEERLKLADFYKFTGDARQDYINLTVFLFLTGYIDPKLIDIQALAGQKTETIEEQKQRLTRDSNK